MLSLIPRDDKYFDRFTDLATRVHAAARTLDEFFSGKSPLRSAVEKVKVLEHECDEISHEILRRIDRTFITPIDREDIHRLAVRTNPTPFSRKMSDVVVRITGELVQGVSGLARRKGVIDHCIAIKKLENEGDSSYHDAVASLFAGEIPVLDVIKWKDIYENLERSVDSCEAVAHILESAVWKSS
jgi:uncharacterized protein Yka (UPF0111/DUF47 family)